MLAVQMYMMNTNSQQLEWWLRSNTGCTVWTLGVLRRKNRLCAGVVVRKSLPVPVAFILYNYSTVFFQGSCTSFLFKTFVKIDWLSVCKN